jgi:ABC-2 type transport system ATP-binding protein
MAVNGANMNICQGDIYGFVGENGSGKTTIIRLITGLIMPHSGGYRLFGVENTDPKISKVRRLVGAVVETPSIYRNMTAKDNLLMQAKILGVEEEDKVRQTLETVGLGYLYNDKKKAANFSLGMRQRLGIAMALLGDPQFLILDEPMNGLDPAGIVEIRELILKLNKQGITFLISSHILTELSLVATKYGIISKGKIVEEITAEQFHNVGGKYLVLQVEDPQSLMELAQRLRPGFPVALEEGKVKISGDVDLNVFLKEIIESGNRIHSINCTETDFEQYYLSVMGGGANA